MREPEFEKGTGFTGVLGGHGPYAPKGSKPRLRDTVSLMGKRAWSSRRLGVGRGSPSGRRSGMFGGDFVWRSFTPKGDVQGDHVQIS